MTITWLIHSVILCLLAHWRILKSSQQINRKLRKSVGWRHRVQRISFILGMGVNWIIESVSQTYPFVNSTFRECLKLSYQFPLKWVWMSYRFPLKWVWITNHGLSYPDSMWDKQIYILWRITILWGTMIWLWNCLIPFILLPTFRKYIFDWSLVHISYGY